MSICGNRAAKVVDYFCITLLLFSAGTACRHAPRPSEDRRQESQPAQNAVELNKDGSPATYVALRRFTDVYGLIKRDYIAPVPFPDLVENTLKGLQELLGKERLFYVRSNNRFSISCSGEDMTVENVPDETRRVKAFADIFALARRTNSELPMPAVIDASTKGLAQVDSHSSFMVPEVLRELQQETKRQSASVGIEFYDRDGMLTVGFPIKGSEASKADILPEDTIIMIDGKPTKGLRFTESTKLLHGEQGTPITLTIMREGLSHPKDVTLFREMIPSINVRHELIEEHYGYIRVYQFKEETDANVEKAANELERASKGNLKGLILDLRYNPGGLLDQVVRVADRFIESGMIVSVDGNNESKSMRFLAHQKETLPAYPLILLANKATSSGSEIILGALQDHKRAIILGNQTLGNATIQTFFPLGNGYALRLTTAIWHTPNGNLIDKKGIVPDILVISNEEGTSLGWQSDRPKIIIDPGEKDTALRIALEILKRTTSDKFADLMAASKAVCEMEQRQGGIP
jgi:carboxyl-terminal processing protease